MRADDRGGDGPALTVDASDLRDMYLAVKGFDKALTRRMRREMKAAGDPLVADVRREIDQIPSSGKYRGGIRIALKAGTRASVYSNSRGVGIRIVTSPRLLPERKRVLAKALNQEMFRHPVFANPEHVRNYRTKAARALAWARGIAPEDMDSWQWVEQRGRPYFGAALARNDNVTRVRTAVVRAVESAAAEVLERKGIDVHGSGD